MFNSRNGILLALCLLLSVGILFSQEIEVRKTVTITGEGVVKVEPDVVTVRFGVVTRDADPVTVRRQNEEAAGKALDAVRGLGIEDRKIQVTVIQLNEILEYDREKRRQTPAGYEASRQVVVVIDDLDLLPELIVRVTQGGANRLFGLSYDISNRDEVQNNALKKAAENARGKAEILCSALNVKLGGVVRISEQSFSFPGPVPVRAMMADQLEAAADMARPEAYAAGEIEVSASVEVEFLIGD
jgi:uncharacterized protein